MNEKELLLTLVDEMKAMRGEISTISTRLDKMDERLDTMDERLDTIEENTKITRSTVNSLVAWADQVAVISQVRFPVQKAK